MEKLNIYQRIIEIKKSIDFFKKDSKSYNYEYVSGTQILTKIKAKMDEFGVVLEPHISHTEGKYFLYEKENKKPSYIIDMPMTYHWVNCDDPKDRAICEWYLFGQQDDISKAFGSALTYSERYFLLKYFGIPTDDLDPDSKGDDKKPTPKKDGKPTPSKPDAKPDKALDAEIKNIDKRVTELRAKKATDKMIGDAIIGTSFGKLNYTQIKDVKTAKEVLTALNNIKTEGK